jgi:hypothetical protein
MDLKQIGVGAGMMKSNGTRRFVNFIDEYPIALNMAFKRVFPFAFERMVTSFRRQRLFVDDQAHYFDKFVYILMTFFGSFKFLFEFTGTERFKHISTPQIREQILKRTEPFGRDFAPHHGSAFLNGGDSFGIGHIVVRGADRANAVRVKPIIVKLFPRIRRGGFRSSFGLFNAHRVNIT